MTKNYDLVVVNDDFNNVFTSGTTMLAYASAVSFSSTGYHTFNLNSDGISALQSKIGSGDFEIGLVAYTDFQAVSPPATSEETIRFANSTLGKPRIEITYAKADNAIFFGTNF